MAPAREGQPAKISSGSFRVQNFFTGSAVIGLCLATPVAIVILMFLNVPMNPALLIVAAVCAVIGLVLAVSAHDDDEKCHGGPPEDEF